MLNHFTQLRRNILHDDIHENINKQRWKSLKFSPKICAIFPSDYFQFKHLYSSKWLSKSTIVLEGDGVTKKWVKTNVLCQYFFLKLLYLLNNCYHKWLFLLDRWRTNKTICIELDMLIWLMTKPFITSVLILVIADPRDPFSYKMERCCKHLQMWQGAWMCL